ncbi:MAG TPA: hypothetical protein VN317_10690 [Candidatus Methanoperedens sp.]|nr:hypothetical protein [Candidatus Methanoperedens sp.]
MTYDPTPAESAWIGAATDPARAAHFAHIAATFNLLDAGLLAPRLADGCTYGSQSVLEDLRGRETVVTYFAEKLTALRDAGVEHLATAELAADPGGRPCTLLRQRASAYGRPGLGTVAGYHRIALAPDGRIVQLFLVTSVPPPEECRGTGLFPGLGEEQLRRAREHEGQRIPLSREVTITLFAMPRVGACDEMARDLQALAPEFAPARLRLITPKNREVCIEHGVTGFPTLLVTWRGATVRVLDGYHTNAQVRAALADLFQP